MAAHSRTERLAAYRNLPIQARIDHLCLIYGPAPDIWLADLEVLELRSSSKIFDRAYLGDSHLSS